MASEKTGAFLDSTLVMKVMRQVRSISSLRSRTRMEARKLAMNHTNLSLLVPLAGKTPLRDKAIDQLPLGE